MSLISIVIYNSLHILERNKQKMRKKKNFRINFFFLKLKSDERILLYCHECKMKIGQKRKTLKARETSLLPMS